MFRPAADPQGMPSVSPTSLAIAKATLLDSGGWISTQRVVSPSLLVAGSAACGGAVAAEDHLELVPERWFFASNPDRTLMRAVLGGTFYVDPAGWSHDLAARLLDAFVSRVGELPYFTTSRASRWMVADEHTRVADLMRGADFALTAVTPDLLELQVADDPDAPATGFRCLEPGRSDIPGFVQITLPLDADAAVLLDLARVIVAEAPVVGGSAGYTFRWAPMVGGNAFDEMYRVTRRFLGFDLQVPELWAPLARRHATTSWLTAVSHHHPDRVGCLEGLEREAEVHLEPNRSCVLVRAGERPGLGDVNSMQWPEAMARAAAWMAPLLPKEFPAPPGLFSEEGAADRWARRLFEVDGWR